MKIRNIEFLELKRIDIAPEELVKLIEDCSMTLRELFLVEVYLKVNGEAQTGDISLWVGHPEEEKSSTSVWVADSLRDMESLNLSVLRATGLGYDDFERDRDSWHPDYDIPDPNNQNKNLDQRFVEAVMHPNIKETVAAPCRGVEEPVMGFSLPSYLGILVPDPPTRSEDIPPLPTRPDIPDDVPPFPATSSPSSSRSLTHPKNENPTLRSVDYDAEIYQLYHNTTSHYKKSIDGYFLDHHEHACRELQNMINVADRGIDLISEEIRSYREVEVDEGSGLLERAEVAG
jgi:hypothetical protein